MANPFCCPRLSVVSNSSHCLTLARSKSFHAPFNSNLIVFIPLNIVEESQRVFYYVDSFLKQTLSIPSVWIEKIFKTCPREIRKSENLFTCSMIQLFIHKSISNVNFGMKKEKIKGVDEFFKIREEFIGLIRIFSSEVIGNRDCYLRTIESGTQRDPL